MEAQYSVLLCNQNLNEYKHKISEWLHTGIKVLWFGNEADVVALKQEYPTFAKEFLLQAYSINIEYYVAAEPPVRCGESHHSGQTEPPCY